MAANPFEPTTSTDRKIGDSKNLSFDEAFLGLGQDDAEILDNERFHINYRLLGSIMILCLMALLGRLFVLQIVHGADYRLLADGNKLRISYLLAPRGLVEDRTGNVIAGNAPSFELDVVTADLARDPATFEQNLTAVAQTVGKNYDELLGTIRDMNQNSYQNQTLVQDISKDQALVLIGGQDRLAGFSVQNSPIRDYKDAPAFAHLTGYTGKITADELAQHPNQNYLLNDYIGKTGVEAQFENYLRGVPGQDRSEIDAAGDFQKTLADIPPVPGNDVKLNIDYGLQKEIYDALTAEMQTIGKTRGAAVATNPQTGEVLALLSLPSFDNNMFARGISSDEYQALLNDDNPLLNRAIAGTYPPGSTVKPMLAVAALSENVITPETEILDDGVIRIGSFTYYGYEHSGLGLMNVYTAIAKSSDIFFYTVGGGNPKDPNITGLGPEKLAEWYRKFHLGSKLGIDLPGEKDGLVADPEWKQAVKNEQWYLGDTYHYSIGQGDLLVTPLQINNWTATIANGGKIMQPYVLNQVINPDGAVIAQGSPHVLAENIFDPQWIKVAQDGMRQTVSIGTARSLNTLPFPVSGKTGTAQFDGSDLSRTHAWFTSYAPSDNPQIALTILIEDGGEGSSVSEPVAKQVYQWWAQNRWQP